MKQDELLFIVTDGLNEKQGKFIDSFVQSYGFKSEYVVFETNDVLSEVNSFQETLGKAENHEKEYKKKPYFLFAVEHGSYFVTRTVEEFGIPNIIHIDHCGERFAF